MRARSSADGGSATTGFAGGNSVGGPELELGLEAESTAPFVIIATGTTISAPSKIIGRAAATKTGSEFLKPVLPQAFNKTASVRITAIFRVRRIARPLGANEIKVAQISSI
jgi:hypothetical protein